MPPPGMAPPPPPPGMTLPPVRYRCQSTFSLYFSELWVYISHDNFSPSFLEINKTGHVTTTRNGPSAKQRYEWSASTASSSGYDDAARHGSPGYVSGK